MLRHLEQEHSDDDDDDDEGCTASMTDDRMFALAAERSSEM